MFPSFLFLFPSLKFPSAVCVSAPRVLLEGVQKDTVWNEHNPDLQNTPVQPIRSLLSDTYGTIIG